MNKFLQNGWLLLRETITEWQADQVTRQAAALAYFTIFSIAPLLILVISVAGIGFGQEDVQQQVIRQAEETFGARGGELIADVLDATYETGSGFLATLFGLGMLFVGASNVFNQLQISLNHIWGVQPKPQRGMFGLVKDRLLSVGMVLVVGFLLLASLILSTALSIFLSVAADLAPGIGPALRLGNTVLSFLIITVLFAMIYKFLPNARVAWGDVWVGAAFTSALFGVGQWAIGIYLTTSGAASAYGAAGSLVVILLWIYYSTNILLLGAEFTQVYARHFGSRIQPGLGYKRAGFGPPAPDSEQESDESEPALSEPIQPEPRRAVVVNVPGEKANRVWFSGFLGGLVVAAAGLIAGVFFGRER